MATYKLQYCSENVIIQVVNVKVYSKLKINLL